MNQGEKIQVSAVDGGVYRATTEALPRAVFFALDAAEARGAALRAIRANT